MTKHNIELNGRIDAAFIVAPGVQITFMEGSTFKGKLIQTKTLHNDDFISKQLHISMSGKLSLVSVELELPKILKASKRASVNHIKKEAEKEALEEIEAEETAFFKQNLKRKALIETIREEAEKEARAEEEAATKAAKAQAAAESLKKESQLKGEAEAATKIAQAKEAAEAATKAAQVQPEITSSESESVPLKPSGPLQRSEASIEFSAMDWRELFVLIREDLAIINEGQRAKQSEVISLEQILSELAEEREVGGDSLDTPLGA
ncbi:MAG: hypothetical protein NWP91_03910 [Rickettsiaceae bacterium]|nr:hypothetical protein [Rickettsiaceae bacterium]MDP5083420.1 hypothetical protein [Rickettsiaceae bacterium]